MKSRSAFGSKVPSDEFYQYSEDVLARERLFRQNVLGFVEGFDELLEQPYTNLPRR